MSTDHDGFDGPAYSSGWVARKLGLAPGTLRTWHRRYDVGPSGRTEGGHGRYLPSDVDRLQRMRRLVLAGLPTAEAARMSADPNVASPTRTDSPHRGREPSKASKRLVAQVRCLSDAVMSLDQPVVEPILSGALRRQGVVPTWTQLVLPVLVTIGERYARRGDYIDAEHMFTECVRTALTEVVTRRRSWDCYPPVLLACLDKEQHSLPLHALAASLAEIGCPTRLLGASVPTDALNAATRQITPRAIFIWSHNSSTACPTDLYALARRRPPIPVVVGGPGWRDDTLPASVTRVDSLTAAIAAVSLGLTASAG